MKNRSKYKEVRKSLIERVKSGFESMPESELNAFLKENTGVSYAKEIRGTKNKVAAALQADMILEELLAPTEPPKHPDIDETPIVHRGVEIAFSLPHGCPRNRGNKNQCEVVALTNEEVKTLFGVRKMGEKYYPQSNCKACRSKSNEKSAIGRRRYQDWKKERDIKKGYVVADKEGSDAKSAG